MKMDVHKDRDGHLKMNPSWFMQMGIVIMLSIVGYFLDQSLNELKEELQVSRIERAQIRADLTAFQIGATGDRFTFSQYREERREIEVALDDIRERITKLEAGH